MSYWLRITLIFMVFATSFGGIRHVASAQETLRAVSMFPEPVVFTRSFLGFVDKVNGDPSGLVQIQFIGGPEALPTSEQAEAVRAGVVDMMYGPGSYYPGIVPETDALIGSNVLPMEQRANGGIALLGKIHREKMNAHYLAHTEGGIGFHIYLREPPPVNDAGIADLSGLKLRAGPFYREFFNRLGAIHVGIPAAEVYTALARGTVDGIGWTSIGVMDFSWDEYLKVRIEPSFSQTDVGIVVNQDRWDSLSEAAKEVLESAAIEYEEESYQRLQALKAEEDAQLRARGMRVVALAPGQAESYLEAAYESIWQRLRERDGTYYDDLRARFYREPQ